MPNEFKPGQSKLMDLPGEIRNNIWDLVLGNQDVHIQPKHEDSFELEYEDSSELEYEDSSELESCLCVHEHSLEDAYEMATTEDPDKEYFGLESEASSKYAVKTNHALARPHYECDTFPGEPTLSLNLSLLRVCRQIYAEACHIPYSSNRFLFENAECFRHFFERRTLAQRQVVTALAFVSIGWYDYITPGMPDYDDEG